MGRNSGGYTVVEVMVVIAITGVLFIGAVLTFEGENGRTGFSQAMQDLSSKIQNYASQVSSGSYPGSDHYDCSAASGQPVLSNGTGQSSDCIFMGRAIHVTAGQKSISSYAIIGKSSGTNIVSASPRPATLTTGSTSNYVLTDNYTLDNGAKILSAKANGTDYNILGIYNVIGQSTGSSVTGANNLSLKAYPCGGVCSQGQSGLTAVVNCIAGTTCGDAGSPIVSRWVLCVQGGNGAVAELDVDSSTSGVATHLNFDAGCS